MIFTRCRLSSSLHIAPAVVNGLTEPVLTTRICGGRRTPHRIARQFDCIPSTTAATTAKETVDTAGCACPAADHHR